MKAVACLICLFLVTVATEEEESCKTLYYVEIQKESDGSKINFPNLKALSLIRPNINNLTATMLYQLEAAKHVSFEWGTVNVASITPQFNYFKINDCSLTSLTIDPTLDYQVEELLLGTNNLKALPAHFNVLKNLKRFSVEHNQIETINAEDFHGFTKLERMFLSNNNIVHISSSPARPTVLPKLNKLFLNSNQLRNVSFANWSGPNLEQILLNENQLTIAHSVFEAFPNLDLLDLENNPLNCGWLGFLKKKVEGKYVYLGRDLECKETGESMEELIERIKRELLV